MEQLNKIEIRGYVGSITVHHMGERDMARFTVATSTAYKDKDGGARSMSSDGSGIRNTPGWTASSGIHMIYLPAG